MDLSTELRDMVYTTQSVISQFQTKTKEISSTTTYSENTEMNLMNNIGLAIKRR